MDFSLDESQEMIRDSARELALLELSTRAQETDSVGLFPWEPLRQIADAGFMGMLLPTAYGGTDSDLLSFSLVVRELAKGCANTALVYVTHVAASHGVLLGGNDEVKQEILPTFAKGSRLAAWAATEPNSGCNVAVTETSARVSGGNYLVNGSKVFITSAEEAHYYVTVVRTNPAPGPTGLSALLIGKECSGFDTGRRFLRLGFNGTSSGELIFNDCQVDRKYLLGTEGGYMPLGFSMAGIGLTGVSSIALALSEASLDLCLKYGKQRLVGGQPLGNLQGVQFMASEISVAVDAMRALLYWAIGQMKDNPAGPPVAAYKAKLFATETALRVIDKAIQLHGGTGYTRELPLERYYRDARGLSLHFMPSEPIKETLGKVLMGLA